MYFVDFLYFTDDFGLSIEKIWTDAIVQYLRQLEEEEDEKHNENCEMHFQRSLKRKHE
jgi:hypothetical protein